MKEVIVIDPPRQPARGTRCKVTVEALDGTMYTWEGDFWNVELDTDYERDGAGIDWRWVPTQQHFRLHLVRPAK